MAPAIDPEIADQLLGLRHEAWRVAGHVLGERRALAEEAVADAYLHAVRHISHTPVRALRTWFLRVTVNAARDLARSERARRQHEAQQGEDMKRRASETQPDPALVAEVRSAIGKLEDRYRLPLVLRHESGLSQVEVANVLELPQGTVASQLKRGLDQLREKLGAAQAGTAPPALTGAIGAGVALQAPASLLATARTILASGALPAAKAGAAASVAATSIFAGWKLLAGLAALVGLSLGTWGLWNRGQGPQNGQARQLQAAGPEMPPPRGNAINSALSAEVSVPGGRVELTDIFRLLHRKAGLKASYPFSVFRNGVRLSPGKIAAGKLLGVVAKRFDLDLETAMHRGEPTAFFWKRPDPETLKQLQVRAASDKETERCIAARWLPSAGSKDAWRLAVKLLGDPSERVRRYARYGISATTGMISGYGYCADPLSYLATPATGKALAGELKALVTRRKMGRPAQGRTSIIRIAARLAQPACVPSLLELLKLELSREKTVYVTRKTRTGSHGWSVSPRNPLRLRDNSLLSTSCSALRPFAGGEAWPAVLRIFKNLQAEDRRVLFGLLAASGKPEAHTVLYGIAGDPQEDRMARHAAFLALVETERTDVIDRLLAMGKKAQIPAHRLAGHRLLRTGHRGVRELAFEELRTAKDLKQLKIICWKLCTETRPGKEILPSLRKLLDADEANTRSAAIGCLGYTRLKEVVPLLAPLLKDKNRQVSSRAAFALGRNATPAAIGALLEMLKTGNVRQRHAAVRALMGTADPRVPPPLMKALKAKDPFLRNLAAEALARRGYEEGFSYLAEVSRPRDTAVGPRTGKEEFDADKAAKFALRALGEIGGKRAAAELEMAVRADIPAAVDALLVSFDPHCRRALLKLARELPEKVLSAISQLRVRYVGDKLAFFELVPHLIAQSRKSGLIMSKVVNARQYVNMGDPRQVAAVMEALANDKDPEVRRRALRVMHGSGRNGVLLLDPAAARLLTRAARKDSDPKVRAEVISYYPGLRALNIEQFLPILLDAAETDPSPEVRRAAVRSLPISPHLSADIPRIRKALAREKNATVRRAIKRALDDWEKHTADELPEPDRPRPVKKPPPEVF